MKKWCPPPIHLQFFWEKGWQTSVQTLLGLQRLQPPSLSLGALSTNPKFRPDLGKILRTTVQRKIEAHQIKKMRGGIVPKSHLFACGFSHVACWVCEISRALVTNKMQLGQLQISPNSLRHPFPPHLLLGTPNDETGDHGKAFPWDVATLDVDEKTGGKSLTFVASSFTSCKKRSLGTEWQFRTRNRPEKRPEVY